MEEWISESLSTILGFQVPEDLIKYVLSIKNDAELNKYMKTFIDFEDPQHKNFYIELSNKKFPSQGGNGSKQLKKKSSKNKQQIEQVTEVEKPTEIPPDEHKAGSKKKTKFVNLYSQEGKNAQVVLLKGRHRCECQAAKHELINNCTRCGRIVCRQEGSGPCLFCGNVVCTPEEQREMAARGGGGARLADALRGRGRPKGWEEALSHRNRLLEYDRTSTRRTHVTDDDSDYFNTNSVWLSDAERGALRQYHSRLQERKHASRRDKKMTFDFAGRQIVEEAADAEPDPEVLETLARQARGAGAAGAGASAGAGAAWFAGGEGARDVAPGISAELLQFDPSVEARGPAPAARAAAAAAGQERGRVQDAGPQEMWDEGRCLSLHQPWASLLVEGIKLHEGRSWYTAHRGRLWIASAAKAPDPAVVRAVEEQCRLMRPDATLKFPTFYPTGCLLGCVNVDDCLPQEEYAKIYPGGESDSPYVFVCSNPVSLRLRFPIAGQHKIYSLDKIIHKAASKAIQKMAKIEAQAA